MFVAVGMRMLLIAMIRIKAPEGCFPNSIILHRDSRRDRLRRKFEPSNTPPAWHATSEQTLISGSDIQRHQTPNTNTSSAAGPSVTAIAMCGARLSLSAPARAAARTIPTAPGPLASPSRLRDRSMYKVRIRPESATIPGRGYSVPLSSPRLP